MEMITWSPILLSQKTSLPKLSPETTVPSERTARDHTMVSLPRKDTNILQVACPVSTFHTLIQFMEPKILKFYLRTLDMELWKIEYFVNTEQL